MRLVIAGLACSWALCGAQADTYGNARFGFFVDVPEQFSVADPEPENGDGRRFRTEDGRAELIVAGGWIIEGSFGDFVTQSKGFERQDGWTLTYESKVGASSAVFSGKKAGRIFYRKDIATCGGPAHAGYRIEYPAKDKALFDSMITSLNASLISGTGTCGQD